MVSQARTTTGLGTLTIESGGLQAILLKYLMELTLLLPEN